VITSLPTIPDTWLELGYQRLKGQLCLLGNVLSASDNELGSEILEDQMTYMDKMVVQQRASPWIEQ
ncbi:hypothetical protein Tco_1140355, partial [Tanacetum coccineum]